MRVLELNGVFADIDEQTAIGVTFSGYDFTQPARPKVATSNTFSLPPTARNLGVIGWAGLAEGHDVAIYSKFTARYTVDNVRFVDNAFARVTSVDSRIHMLLIRRADIWETLRAWQWADFFSGFMDWLADGLAIPSEGNPEASYSELLSRMTANPYVALRYYLGNLSADDAVPEELGSIYLGLELTAGGSKTGGHFVAYVPVLFDYIEHVTGYNFKAGRMGYPSTVWSDAVVSAMYINAPEIIMRANPRGTKFWVMYGRKSGDLLSPHNDAWRDGLTVFDFVQAFFQHINAVIEQRETSAVVWRFDQIDDAPLVDFSKLVEGVESFAPFVQGHARRNWVRFESVFEGGSKNSNARLIECGNDNLEGDTELARIKAHVPAVRDAGGAEYVLRLAEAKAIELPVFMLDSGASTIDVNFESEILGLLSASRSVPRSALYDLGSEYTVLTRMLERPQVWTIRKWMPTHELHDLSYMRRYSIPRLGGCFFISNINGYNPDASKQAVSITLVKVSNDVLLPQAAGIYWLDNAGAIFADNAGDGFY